MTGVLLVLSRIGAAPFFGLLVAAQLVMGVLIDRFELIGFPERGLSPGRIIGVVLLVTGALLVRVFWKGVGHQWCLTPFEPPPAFRETPRERGSQHHVPGFRASASPADTPTH